MALVLLRLVAAAMIAGACFYAAEGSLHPLLVIPLALAALLLMLGLTTRIVAPVCAAIALGVGLTLPDWRGALLVLEAVNLVSIGLLGAGAYSMDAYLFGRRVIRLDSN